MGIKITNSSVVTGSKKLSNDFYFKHFDKQGKDIRGLLKSIGRKDRFVVGNLNETTLTLASRAVDKVLLDSNLTGADIDIIIVSSQFPEYTVPAQSTLIHSHIKGKSAAMVLDINTNCLGMLNGLDIVHRMLSTKEAYTRAILVGSDVMSRNCKKDDEYTYPVFGDSACAILIEKSASEEVGVIGTSYRTESQEANMCLYPECGFREIDKYLGASTKLSWISPTTEGMPISARSALDDILRVNNVDIKDIDWLCGSQFTIKMLKTSAKLCEVPMDRVIYIGDKYGYTGTSSPFISFHEGRKQGKIKEGDLVLFWTVGVGYSVGAMLLRV